MQHLSRLAQALVGPVWVAVLVWSLLVVLVWFFVIGRLLPGRGATPLAGARVTWFSPQHLAELEQYRQCCVTAGRSLVWWRLVCLFLVTWPSVLGAAIGLTLAALFTA
jgi:hypothetical protein